MVFASYGHWQCFVVLSIIASQTYAAVVPSEYKISNEYNNIILICTNYAYYYSVYSRDKISRFIVQLYYYMNDIVTIKH